MYDLNIVHNDYRRLEGSLTVDQPGEFFLAMTAAADPNEGLATGVAGLVTDQATGEPVPEVVVNVAVQGRVATTSTSGRFTLPDLLPGRYEVTFSHLGYQQRTDSVDVNVGRVSVMEVALSVEAIELDPIEVTVERQDVTLQGVGFYERESDGWGSFVDREEPRALVAGGSVGCVDPVSGRQGGQRPRHAQPPLCHVPQGGRGMLPFRVHRRRAGRERGRHAACTERPRGSDRGGRSRDLQGPGGTPASVLGHEFLVRGGAYLDSKGKMMG